MPLVDHVVSSPVSRSGRARQVEALFDVPPQERATLSWKGKVPIEDKPWNVGLIVGPSGCGKSTIARHLFGADYHPELEWGEPSVIDDIAKGESVEAITNAFSSVGFNTIPAWLRPFSVLSTGEQFRVDVARRILELSDPIVVDEFSSVVDRQVAQIGSHAIAKYVRQHDRRFVAVSCHFDIIEWLQPDWVLEPASMDFRWRSVQPRPRVDIEVARVSHDIWEIFAPFHYLTSQHNNTARCFVAFVGGAPAAFLSVIHFPHPKVKNMKKLHRLVCLPDYQGIGIGFHIVELISSAYKAAGYRVRSNPSHPALIRSRDRSPHWELKKRPGTYGGRPGRTSREPNLFKARPSAIFEYVGKAMDKEEAARLIGG